MELNFVVINEDNYKNIVENIALNQLLILFTMTCVCGLVCSIKKPNKDYIFIQNTEPIKGEIINKV